MIIWSSLILCHRGEQSRKMRYFPSMFIVTWNQNWETDPFSCFHLTINTFLFSNTAMYQYPWFSLILIKWLKSNLTVAVPDVSRQVLLHSCCLAISYMLQLLNSDLKTQGLILILFTFLFPLHFLILSIPNTFYADFLLRFSFWHVFPSWASQESCSVKFPLNNRILIAEKQSN